MEEVKLLGVYTSPFLWRVIWALKLKGIPFEYIEDDLSNKSELLLKSNPIHKKIPVLIHNGKPVVESTIILEYIEETWPGKNPLLPKDAYERAIARFWTKFGEDKGSIFFAFLFTAGEEQQKAVKECQEALKVLEEHGLGEKKFFNGDTIGLTDLEFGWIAHWTVPMGEAAGVKVVDEHSFPRLHAWAQNFKSVPVIKENLPDSAKMLAYYRTKRENLFGSSHQH